MLNLLSFGSGQKLKVWEICCLIIYDRDWRFGMLEKLMISVFMVLSLKVDSFKMLEDEQF